MRDKNLDLNQLNIQLKEIIHRKCHFDDKFLTGPVFDTPTRRDLFQDLGIIPGIKISYPRDFRLLRTLAISQWYFPENLHWRIWLDLTDFSFSQLNEKQKLEISILLSSKENMLKFLIKTKRYTSFEFFGNIVGNDLEDLKKELKFRKVFNSSVKETIRRRGYKDKGSRRPDHRWLPDFDYTFTELQLKKETKDYQRQQILIRILKIFENE